MKTHFSVLTLALASIMMLSACHNAQPLQSSSNKSSSGFKSHSVWSYAGENGPQYWGDIHGNEVCKTGSEQSPINIAETIIVSDDAPNAMFFTSDIEVDNNGHTIVYTPKDGNHTTDIHGDIFSLVQFHYHVPSEHQIVGVNYPAELHFVHANEEGELAVLGVMLDPTATNNTQLTELLISSNVATENGTTALVENVDLNALLPASGGFYNYAGSLTTPPCREQVKWYVASKALSVSASEIAAMKQLYDGNNRPVQPLGHRQIRQIQ